MGRLTNSHQLYTYTYINSIREYEIFAYTDVNIIGLFGRREVAKSIREYEI